MQDRIPTHAVVLGAGIAGLLAARVLTETYDRVTLVERDRVVDGDRRGVPQGRHAHALMPRGAQILDELFPGLSDELVAAGAVRVEPLADFRATVGGHTLVRAPIGATAVQATRPFLERHIRDRVLAVDGVELLDERDVVGLITEPGAVTGVRILRRTPCSAEEWHAADLVVDALGRGSRTPAWLEALGYERPAEDSPRIDVAYASCLVRLAPGTTGIEPMMMVGPVPGRARGMVMVAVEHGCHLLTLAGIGAADRPEPDPDGFRAFAATVAAPDVLASIDAAERVVPIVGYRYPSYQRRHYERLRRFPSGLLVVGDALCSFSPVYAQGMTVAALQALALRRCLAQGPDNLARRFFRAAAAVVDGPWRMAIGADLALPEVPGPRPPAVRLLNRYVERVLAAAERDPVVARAFMRVTAMLDAPTALFAPAVALRALRPRRPVPVRDDVAPAAVAVAEPG